MEKYTKKDKTINYEVIRTNKKKEYYCFEIKDDIIYISVPEYATEKDIKLVLNQQFINWYYKINAKDIYFVHFQGKKYNLKCAKGSIDKVIVKDDEIIIKSINMTNRHYKNVLYNFFTKVVEEEITKLIYDAAYDFKEIKIPKIIVKPLKGYMGLYRKNHIEECIEISPIIAKYDPKYIKVLLYHELCHSLVRGHQDNFWNLLTTKLKDGEKLNKEYRNINYNSDYF